MNSLSIFNPLFADSVLDSLNHDSPHFGVFSPLANASYPTVDVRETSGAYIMDIDLPGYTEKDGACSPSADCHKIKLRGSRSIGIKIDRGIGN